MNNLLALPMYGVNPSATQSLVQAIVTLLARHDIAAQPICPDNLRRHWQDGRLLLSQTCGYPLVTHLPAVQVVGIFNYAAPGCRGPAYRSWLVARERQATLSDYHGRRAVANSQDSHSGYNALRYVAAQQGVVFSSLMLSGGHRQSLAALRDAEADIAAIDCVSWALLARFAPDTLRGLHIIGETPLMPGLPLITAASTSADQLKRVRAALEELVQDHHWRRVCADNLIAGFSPAQREDYQPVLAWEQAAAARGVFTL